MRVDKNAVLRYRALFGVGFVALGGVTLWRVLVAPAPGANKTLGGLLALGMVGLGIARIVQYARARNAARR